MAVQDALSSDKFNKGNFLVGSHFNFLNTMNCICKDKKKKSKKLSISAVCCGSIIFLKVNKVIDNTKSTCEVDASQNYCAKI